jgi:hypothetical protein
MLVYGSHQDGLTCSNTNSDGVRSADVGPQHLVRGNMPNHIDIVAGVRYHHALRGCSTGPLTAPRDDIGARFSDVTIR